MTKIISTTFIDSLKDLSFTERHLEPESMEETAEDYDAMDFNETNAAFVDFMSPLIAVGAHVADMGCGPGDIAILLAQKRPDLTVYGVDLAPAMLKLAAQKAQQGDVRSIEWKVGDITKPLFKNRALDFVYSHTTLHHLPDLKPFLLEMSRALKPSGGFALRDLRRPATPQQALEWIKQASGDTLPQRHFELFFYSLRASLTFEEIQTLVREMQLPGTLEVTKNPDRYWVFHKAMSSL